MLPTSSKGRSASTSRQPNVAFPHYLRRIIKAIHLILIFNCFKILIEMEECSQRLMINNLDRIHWKELVPVFKLDIDLILVNPIGVPMWQQMDVEYTFWQMLYLCTSPKVVYQHTKYHKQTKNQWARDDPAFVVICSLLLAVSTLAYCAAKDMVHNKKHNVVCNDTRNVDYRSELRSEKFVPNREANEAQIALAHESDRLSSVSRIRFRTAFLIEYRSFSIVQRALDAGKYDHSIGHAVYVVLSVLLFHFVLTGAVLATCCW
ncbi:Protein unc-50-like protein [Bienertia sinuspersici]